MVVDFAQGERPGSHRNPVMRDHLIPSLFDETWYVAPDALNLPISARSDQWGCRRVQRENAQ
jgi:hypothetical protein